MTVTNSISNTFPTAHIDGRVLPSTTYQNNGQPYVISNQRLQQIRGNFLYWFYDQGGNGIGDYQSDIHTSTPQIHKNFNFQLPFFGFRFNYTRVSIISNNTIVSVFNLLSSKDDWNFSLSHLFIISSQRTQSWRTFNVRLHSLAHTLPCFVITLKPL